jgi:hypothetical protein
MNDPSTKDLIIGAYTSYNWDRLKCWANSIDRCGFTGDKVVIAYNSDEDTVNQFLKLNFKVVTFNQDPISKNYYWPDNEPIIFVQRFFDLWQYLANLKDSYRYVISTDVTDVVFQTNPVTWLENNIGDSHIVASCESLKFEDAPWGSINLKGNYPLLYEQLKSTPIWNCGVHAGTMQAIKDLWMQIWFTCQCAEGKNPDQAAYNILLNLFSWKRITKFAMGEDAWACQCGTTADPTFLPIVGSKLLEPMPIWEDDMSKTTNHVPHAILHQYNRVPIWRSAIEKIYG